MAATAKFVVFVFLFVVFHDLRIGFEACACHGGCTDTVRESALEADS